MLDLQTIQKNSPKQLSGGLVAWILAFYNDPTCWNKSDMDSLTVAVDHAVAQFYSSQVVLKEEDVRIKRDPREYSESSILSSTEKVKIFTDYELLQQIFVECPNDHPLHERFQLVSNRNEADYVHTCLQTQNFLMLPANQRICQYPYEGCIVRKDLLPLTVRKFCYDRVTKQAPSWWLPCYDLSTEFHVFSAEYNNRKAAGKMNKWIVKPAQATRAQGHKIIHSSHTLRDVALAAPLLSKEIVQKMTPDQLLSESENQLLTISNMYDRVAQLFVERPLLVKNRKFDMRFFVLVRSFHPFQAYCHKLHYARLANKPYNDEQLDDHEVSITVSAYDVDEEKAQRQERVFHTNLQHELEVQYPHLPIDYSNEVFPAVLAMFRDLFVHAGWEIGHWPMSRAYYSVDVIYELNENRDEDEKLVQPKLLEVNYMGDWTGVEAAVADRIDIYHEWIHDVLTVLATDIPTEELDNHPRLIRL